MSARETRKPANRTAPATAPAAAAIVPWDSAEIEAMITACGLRPTRARRWIVAMLASVRVHPTVEQLQQMLRDHDREIRQATLYQNLNRLTRAGVIMSFMDNRGLLRFDANTMAHHHLLCTRCGRIADVEAAENHEKRLARLVSDLAESSDGWRIEDARMELRAVCPPCRGH